MTASTPFNLQSLHGRSFEGFVQFQIPTTAIPPSGSGAWYRMKERQTMSFTMQFDRATHYDDAGLKAVDPAGFSHSFSMDMKLTSDLFDTPFDNNQDKKSIGWWIYRNSINQPIQVIFVTSFAMLGTSPSNINLKFVLDPSSFSTGLGPSGGSPTLSVSGAVISITSALRSTTTDQ